MSECYIRNLNLKNFRNFSDKEIHLDSCSILITGLNGAGKTSLLEAISMLSAGKGLRGAKFQDQIKEGSDYWFLEFELKSYLGNVIINQKNSRNSSKRTLELNSQNITASELSNFASVFWLTPQLNTLFQESQSDRRKFFDRIVYAFHPNHASSIHKYEHYQRERLKILLMDYYDNNWVEVIEVKLTELAIEIGEARLKIKEKLQSTINDLDTTFPKIELVLESKLEDIIRNNSNPYQLVKEEYRNSRSEDSRAHRNHFGALKTDFYVIHLSKNMPAKFCSTGEQQSCLITLLLAQTESFIKEYSKKPILLLDELFVHLDYQNKAYLTDYINRQKIQTFVTSTEAELCIEFSNNAKIISLS